MINLTFWIPRINFHHYQDMAASPKFTASTLLNYSPRKTRSVIDVIRGSILSQALIQLRNNNRPKSKKIYALLISAASNLKLVEGDFGQYRVSTIVAEEAQKLYRTIPRSRGSAHRIARRWSRIKVILSPMAAAVDAELTPTQEVVTA